MGTSVVCKHCKRNPRDHPHAYGDKKYCGILKNYLRGSSPRVWGQVLRLCRHPKFTRIIPTRMGTRVAFREAFRPCWDHPHAYGDKQARKEQRQALPGSSPRVWGQVRHYRMILLVGGIIPTRMGTRALQGSAAHCA